MKKENLGLELIQSRFEGLTEIWIEVDCQDEYLTEVTAKIKIEIESVSGFRSKEEILERRKERFKQVRKYASMGRAMVTLVGIGESTYDKRDLYRITNRWYEEVECRPFKNDCYEVFYTEKVNTPLKSTNAIMKAVEMAFDYVEENRKEEN